MASKTVGAGGDFANMAAYQAYFNALDMTAHEYCYLMPGETVDTVGVYLSPKSNSGNFKLYITPGVGNSWRDNANVRNNALRYNPANGAALRSTVGGAYGIEVVCPAILEGVQLKGGTTSTFPLKLNGNNSEARFNIVDANTSALFAVNLVGGGIIFEDNFVIQNGTAGGVTASAGGCVLSSNTIVAPNGNGSRGIGLDYAVAPVMKNNNVWGFTTDYEQTAGTGSTNNATSKAAFGGTGYGVNGQVSVPAAAFMSLTAGSLDLRLKVPAAGNPANPLIDTGVAAGQTQDASKFPRPSGSAYDIGAWESQAAAAPADTTAPILSAPAGSASSATTASLSVATDEAGGTLYYMVDGNATDGVATVKAGSSAGVSATGTQSGLTVSGLTPGTTYYPHFVQVDAAGNTSAVANGTSFTTPALDTVAPTWPNGAAITPGAITSSSLAGSYPAASDNVGVHHYEISKDGGATWANNGTGTTWQFVGLAAATNYPIAVSALDAQGNRSVLLTRNMQTSAASTGSFKTKPLANNTGTLYASGTAVAWEWHQARIGTQGNVTYGSGQLAADGTLTAPGLPLGAGFLLVGLLGANLAADKPYYQPGTAA